MKTTLFESNVAKLIKILNAQILCTTSFISISNCMRMLSRVLFAGGKAAVHPTAHQLRLGQINWIIPKLKYKYCHVLRRMS